ncbi:hypothetical protein Y032_0561g3476 [Ancylostoma ceylanicum]|uniref:Uncharacterized protein n=1 Tax=Ancylostoma ceylanicum TaxID=53326 RepID=A0A016WQU8_9BILA|nr:hypothetical protein Y032_0561g3476 [Ancylostoma ceylanicum]
MLPTYAEGNAQQSDGPVLAQVTWYWRDVPQNYGLKFNDVNAVLKALLQAITRRPVQYLEGGLEWLKTTLFTQNALKVDAGGDREFPLFDILSGLLPYR